MTLLREADGNITTQAISPMHTSTTHISWDWKSFDTNILCLQSNKVWRNLPAKEKNSLSLRCNTYNDKNNTLSIFLHSLLKGVDEDAAPSDRKGVKCSRPPTLDQNFSTEPCASIFFTVMIGDRFSNGASICFGSKPEQSVWWGWVSFKLLSSFWRVELKTKGLILLSSSNVMVVRMEAADEHTVSG